MLRVFTIFAFLREKNTGNSILTREMAIKKAIKYCQEHGILRQFLELHAKEVFNMLSTEWNPELAKEVWYEEGLEEGREQGALQEKLISAGNFKKLGVSTAIISQATGLSIEEIEKL